MAMVLVRLRIISTSRPFQSLPEIIKYNSSPREFIRDRHPHLFQ